MALVTLKEALDWADKKGIAIPSFNIDNIDIAQSLMIAAEQENYPLILAVGQGAIRVGRLKMLAEVVKALSENSKIPVVLHLDHGSGFEQAIQCIECGFTSVMFDGSRYPLEENIKQTKLVVKAAKAVGISVEGEVGPIPGVEDGINVEEASKADINDVRKFIENVGVDALAVSIGNAHGIYKSKPNLDLELLKNIHSINDAPKLVLHGGSGLDKDAIMGAIDCGIRKINVATEIRLAYVAGLNRSLGYKDIYKCIDAARESIVNVAIEKIKLFSKGYKWEV